MKKIKIISVLSIISILSSIFLSLFKYDIEAAQTVSTDINSINTSKYPLIKEKIESVKKEHPNWNFKILYTGIDWEKAISYEYTGHGSSPKNLVPDSSNYRGDWICEYCGDTAYDSGSWKCASISAIKYMMDPRASLNSTDIFQFLELSYNQQTGYSRDVTKMMVSGSFLNNDTYINTIMDSLFAEEFLLMKSKIPSFDILLNRLLTREQDERMSFDEFFQFVFDEYFILNEEAFLKDKPKYKELYNIISKEREPFYPDLIIKDEQFKCNKKSLIVDIFFIVIHSFSM